MDSGDSHLPSLVSLFTFCKFILIIERNAVFFDGKL